LINAKIHETHGITYLNIEAKICESQSRKKALGSNKQFKNTSNISLFLGPTCNAHILAFLAKQKNIENNKTLDKYQ